MEKLIVTCDMTHDCAAPITHIGSKGYVYCADHAVSRRGWENCRRMRMWELNLIRSGEPLPSYKPIRKPAPVQKIDKS